MTRPIPPAERRRLPAEDRRAQIVAAAAALFSERGFSVSTRELADQLDVTQALLYRHFGSKQDIIDAVFTSVFIDNWDPAMNERLADRAVPFTERLFQFYQDFAARFSDQNMRLFMRASLDGMRFPDRYSFALNERILEPVIAELRHEAGLPPIGKRPVVRGERELALMLHGAIVFLGIRRHVYRMPLPDDLGHYIEIHVRTFVAGALDELRRVHTLPPDHPLSAEMVAKPRDSKP